MAKFSGNVGFVDFVETAPGVITPIATERTYRGDVLRKRQSWESVDQINPNLRLDHRISIVGDEFAVSNLNTIRYVTYSNVKWTVVSVEVKRPRLILSLKGVYNG